MQAKRLILILGATSLALAAVVGEANAQSLLEAEGQSPSASAVLVSPQPPVVLVPRRRRISWPVPVPEREFTASISGWSVMGGSGGSVGLGYARFLTRDAAIEAGVDAGHALGRHFGLVYLQARGFRSGRDSGTGSTFMTIGIAAATGAGGEDMAPRGLGFVVGGGGWVPVTPGGRFGIRADVQLLTFGSSQVGFRLSAGLVMGMD